MARRKRGRGSSKGHGKVGGPFMRGKVNNHGAPFGRARIARGK